MLCYKLCQSFSNKQVDELPTLLSKAGAMERLEETITDLEVFRRLTLTEEGKFDLIKFWNQVKNKLNLNCFPIKY